MKLLICLFAVLVGANAGIITSGLVSAPVSYVQSSSAVHTVHVVKQPVVQSVTSTVYSSPAHVYHSTPIVSAPIVSAPLVSSVPVVSTSYGLNGGLRYASTYGFGGHTRVVNVLNGGILKH